MQQAGLGASSLFLHAGSHSGTYLPRGYNPYMKNDTKRVHQCTAFFEANERGGYTVGVPSLPGLVTEGKNMEHARSVAKDAIRCYIGGLKKAKEPIPVERKTAQLKISVIAYAESQTPPSLREEG